MRNYLDTQHPTSNKIDGQHYYILIAGHGIHRADTFDDLETLLQQTEWNKQTIKKAVMMRYGLPVEFIPETRQERFNREEGRERCQRIAEEVDAFAEGRVYKCPDCDEVVEMPEDVGDKFTCPVCGEVHDINDFEQLGVYDYLDDSLDIEYRIDRNKDYRSCEICVGYGGPNIYIDTADAYIKLYWGSTREQYPIKYETRDEIDDWARDMWGWL